MRPLPLSTVLGLLFLALVVAGLSLAIFSAQSLRLDESQSMWQTSHTLPGMYYIIAQDVHVPLYHTLLFFWQRLVGTEIATLRLMSLILFLLGIPAIYALGRYAFNEAIGLFAAVLFSFSPFMNWYGNEIRMYSLLTLVTIINQLCFVGIFRRRGAPGGWWWAYGLSLIVGLYTHYFFLLSLIAQGIFLVNFRRIFQPGSLRRLLIVLGVAFVTFAPWLLYVNHLGLANYSRPVIPEPSVITLFNTFSQFLFGFQTDYTNSLLLSLWPLVVLLGFLALQRHKPVAPEAIYFLIALAVPVAIAFLASIVWRPVYLSRYLVFTLPSLYLLVAWLFARFSPRVGNFARHALVLGMLFTLTIQILSADTPVKENYREASEYLSAHASGQDIIAVSAPFTIYPVEYYYRGPARLTTFPNWNRSEFGPIPAFSEEVLVAEASPLAESYDRLWLLLSYDQGYEEDVRLYFDTRLERLEHREFSPGLNLYVYRLRYNNETIGTVVNRLRRQGSLAQDTTTP